MSLVGSLEDLGLGDILQIVSLSRKSGLLLLRSEEGEGRIVFCDGLVRAAFVKGEAEDLKSLLVASGFVSAPEFDDVTATAAAHGDPVTEVLAQRTEISVERLNSLRREHVERSVFRMFAWKTGEFSFEIRDAIDDRDRELLLPTGINSQYLTMEATRLSDEHGDCGDDDIEFGTVDDAARGTAPEVVASAEPATGPVGDPFAEAPAAEPADALALAVAQRLDAEDDEGPAAEAAELEAEVVEEPEEAPAAGPEAEPLAIPADAPREAVAAPPAAAPDPDSDPPPRSVPVMVLIDPDLGALEWQKSVLAPICKRIHIFQRADGGIARIRQYLRRGSEPVVLVSSDVPADPLSGIQDAPELVRRLRAHQPHMPILLVATDPKAGAAPDGAHAVLQRPANHRLANRRAWPKLEPDGETLRAALLRTAGEVAAPAPVAAAPQAASADPLRVPAGELQRLKRMSDRLRDPSIRGEVLALILEYAGEFFERVAIFMVREDEAQGMTQSGLAACGGPSDAEFRKLVFPAREPAWFRAVLDRREGVAAAPEDAGDRALAGRLGSGVPAEAYVAPIESNQEVVALVYADNLPGGAPLADTTSLEIVLHEAGLALERALLERALATAAERAPA